MNSEERPQDAKPLALDFSRFHPLDHVVGTLRCRSCYGGIRYHLALLWEYKCSDAVFWLPRRLFKCPFGRHQLLKSQRSAFCSVCRFKRPLNAKEQAHMDELTQRLRELGEALRDKRRKRDGETH